MRFLSVFFLFILSTPVVWAALADGSHIAQSAETLKQLQWSFKPYPGANPAGTSSSFITNSLSIGVTDNLEIGVVPLAWQGGSDSQMRMQNFNLRYVLFRNGFWTFSSGLQRLSMDFKTPTAQSEIGINSLLLANTLVLNPNWRITHNLVWRHMIGQTRYEYVDAQGNAQRFEFPLNTPAYNDNYLDLSYTKSITNVWSFGISHATDSVLGFNLAEKATWGAGISHTWNLRRSWLSQLTIGFHNLDNLGSRILLGLAF